MTHTSSVKDSFASGTASTCKKRPPRVRSESKLEVDMQTLLLLLLLQKIMTIHPTVKQIGGGGMVSILKLLNNLVIIHEVTKLKRERERLGRTVRQHELVLTWTKHIHHLCNPHLSPTRILISKSNNNLPHLQSLNCSSNAYIITPSYPYEAYPAQLKLIFACTRQQITAVAGEGGGEGGRTHALYALVVIDYCPQILNRTKLLFLSERLPSAKQGARPGAAGGWLLQ